MTVDWIFKYTNSISEFIEQICHLMNHFRFIHERKNRKITIFVAVCDLVKLL